VEWHGVTVRDWEALMWTVPAVQLADPPLARELLLRMCEMHGYAPGRGVHYLDGTLFEPGFALEGVASYALATDRYIRDTGDDRVVDEPALADTLYLSAEDLDARKDKRVPLYSTEVSPSGAPAAFAFTLHANAVTASALDILRRTLDEETARGLQDPDAVRAAIGRHFLVEEGGRSTFASAIDLAGATSVIDDPAASALWLPLYEACVAAGFQLSAHGEGDRCDAELARATVCAADGSRRAIGAPVAQARAARRWMRCRNRGCRRTRGGEWRRRVPLRVAGVVGVVRHQRARRASVARGRHPDGCETQGCHPDGCAATGGSALRTCLVGRRSDIFRDARE
jgi:hypothetical protein